MTTPTSDTTAKDAARRIRLKLKNDFDFYAANALKIRTKDAKIVAFSLNDAQRILHEAIEKQQAETGMIRVVILKARQQGLSTYVGGRIYFTTSQNTARKAIVVTHKGESTTALFNMTKRYHDNVPTILKPSTSYSSRRELAFDKLDSSYMVATAGGDGIGRGETITDAHLSELAFWKEAFARENMNGLLQAIPDVPGTSVFIESTANGVTGPFADFWNGAVEGVNGYIAVFIPWFMTKEYRAKPPKGFDRTPDEEKLIGLVYTAYGMALDDAQLYWRRLKIHKSGPDLFKQEYPAFPEEAFLTTGRPVFDPQQLTERKASLGPIQSRLSLILGQWEETHMGELCVFEPIDPGGAYYIGADVAMGVRNGDFSVAQVLDERKRQVATWRGHVHPDYFADILNALGRRYNNAKIAVEANNHGLLTVNLLYKHLNYPNVFTAMVEDTTADVETPKLGFQTNAKTKPMIIDDLRASLRLNEMILNDSVTIKEMLSYVVKESGKLEAEEGCYDDCVMALAIANHIHDGVWKPIVMKSSDYVENI